MATQVTAVSAIDCYLPSNRIRILADQGAGVPLTSDCPIRRYFNSGQQMLRMARVYQEEGDLERAFVIYTRYITIFIEKIRQHPEYKDADPKLKAEAKAKCREIFPIAEGIKAKLLLKYEAEFKRMLAIQEQARQEMEKEQKKKLSEQIEKTDEKTFEERVNERIQTKLSQLEDEETHSNREDISRPRSTNPSAPPSYHDTRPMSRDARDEDRAVPKIDRSTKPSSLLGGQTGESLRNIIIPSCLSEKFLQLALSNTARNIETCGILAGRFASNLFTITHVLIPAQKGTSDSCITENEERLFLYQDKYDLITLGWIHTHPSQTAFLSSIDLHTHCSYQIMLPEAIAIVCAPKFESTGVFSLTRDFGLDLIANCQQTGFHPHPTSPPIFESSKHILFDDSVSVNIVDLR
ncbi:STAM-binding protein-like A [Brevipalpus obovatus]|uniref:STAM-binding protein-like A n=1 Tax=Brevipalpus obovatus TaxID=246614 RepID=UPI003D9F616E